MKLLPLLMLLLLPAVVQAQFTFTTNNGTITITGYTGAGGAVIIPSSIHGRAVTRIGTNAFYNCGSLTSVTIPNSVTNIGNNAFYNCVGLTGVTIPNSVTSIGTNAFYFCCNLTSVRIPSNVASIRDNTFSLCFDLTNVTIGNKVTSIGANAFYCCDLTRVTIPNSVTNIGVGAFAGSFSLSAITVNTSNPAYSSVGGILFNKSQTTLVQWPGGLGGSYTIPNIVTNIGAAAFESCHGLTNIIIPNSITSIGANAFDDCGLTGVAIPNSVTNIGTAAFAVCYSLSAITVDTNNPAYRSVSGALFNKSQTTLIQCPSGLGGSYSIPNGVTSIGIGAFSSCHNLTGVAIPNSVTNIGIFAFENCTSLTNIIISNGVTSIGLEAFGDCGLTSVTIPNSVTNIEGWAFADCTNLTGVYFQGNAPSIGSYVFYFDNKATVYYLPGTTGWGATFGGLPTVLWNPQAQTSGTSFGMQTNQFGFNITGSSNLVIVVEACTNLANPAWTPVSTNTLNTFIGTNGTSYFSDPQWTNYPGRFYRLNMP